MNATVAHGGRAELAAALTTVAGYFSEDEAWALNRAVSGVRTPRAARVVEIGSYEGRSTIAIGLALRDRNGGRCYSIDPHAPTGKESYAREHGELDTYEAYRTNVRSAGVDDYVETVRATSEFARGVYDGAPIDVLFVDGSHDYEDVRTDIALWTPLLAPASVVAFNDPFSPGVNRALRAYVAWAAGTFADAYHVNNTLFLVRSPAPPKPVSLAALRAYLFVEGQRFKLFKLLAKGCFEALGIVYVRPDDRRLNA